MSIKERRERIDDLRARQEIARIEGKTGAIAAGNVIFYLIVAVLIVGLIMWLT